MASEKALLPAANIRNLLEEDGLICIEDPIVGERVDQMRRKGFPFLTEEGLDFCRLGTLDDKAGLSNIQKNPCSLLTID